LRCQGAERWKRRKKFGFAIQIYSSETRGKGRDYLNITQVDK